MGSFTTQPFYSHRKTAPTIPTGQEAGWASGFVQMLCRREKCCVAARNQTPIPLLLGLQHSHYTDCAASVSIQSKNQAKT
jgi:hypothetical protein